MLTNIRKILFIAVVLLLPTLLFADGKMFSKYAREEVNTEIPYQRAAIIFADGIETMVLQSKYGYETRYSKELADIADLAWVVPVPSAPELASMETSETKSMFWELNNYTRAKMTIIFEVIIKCGILIFLLTAIIIMCSVLANRKKTESWFYKHSAGTTNIIAGILVIMIISSIIFPALGRAKETIGDGVELISSRLVGIYDTKVVRSDNPDAIINWLNENGFKYSDSDRETFSSYIKMGWCFVVAKVKTKADSKDDDYYIYDGLPAPLLMRFASSEPVYPMALTGTGGFDTEVLIYLLADKKMACDNLELRYAATGWNKDDLSFSYYKTEPANFVLNAPDGNFWLMRFRSTLKPEQMKNDIYFRPAPDQISYREHIITLY